MLEVAIPSFSPNRVHTPKAYCSQKCWILFVKTRIILQIKISTSEKVISSTKNPAHKYKAWPTGLKWLISYFFEYNCKNIHVSIVLNPDNKQHN